MAVSEPLDAVNLSSFSGLSIRGAKPLRVPLRSFGLVKVGSLSLSFLTHWASHYLWTLQKSLYFGSKASLLRITSIVLHLKGAWHSWHSKMTQTLWDRMGLWNGSHTHCRPHRLPPASLSVTITRALTHWWGSIRQKNRHKHNTRSWPWFLSIKKKWGGRVA